MISGIDVDGVLTNLYKSVKKEYKKFSKIKNGRCIINKSGRSLSDIFGVSRAEDEEFFEKYMWTYAENSIYYSSASKYLKLLKKAGHTLYIVTARAFAGRDDENGKRMRNLIETSMKKAGIIYDKIFYTSESKSKLPIIKELGIEVFIDDSHWNIEELSKHIPVICFEQIYNRKCEFSGVLRARNWKNVYNCIELLNKKRVNN